MQSHNLSFEPSYSNHAGSWLITYEEFGTAGTTHLYLVTPMQSMGDLSGSWWLQRRAWVTWVAVGDSNAEYGWLEWQLVTPMQSIWVT